jgi:beta-1,4-mannosyl-glycoprotein beta-1,4-N-acetylglucosaminyltransferase
MIIDCFPFFKELDLLEIRLNELDPVIDYFVLVEASKTQSKLDKPFYF